MALPERVTAVVVGGVDVGEADRIVRFLCAELGRVDARAPAVRKGAKRYGGALALGARVSVTLRKRGDRYAVADVDRLAEPRRAREDLDRIAALAWGCELCAALAPEHHPAEELHGLLGAWLDLLEQEAPVTPSALAALVAKALTFAGLAPALLRCARCDRALVDPVVFSVAAGGGLHAGCGPGTPVTAEELAVLDALRRLPLVDVLRPGAPVTTRPWLLADFAEHHTGRHLKSRDFLHTVGETGRR